MKKLIYAKRLIAAIVIVSMTCSSFVAAEQRTNYELGLAEKRNGKWANALYYFKAISENDPRYEDALNEMADVSQLQKQESDKKRRQYDAENLQNQLDKGFKRCEQLYQKNSPEVHECVGELQSLVNEVRVLMQSRYDHDGLVDLDGKLETYREFDRLAMPVTEAKNDWKQLAKTGEEQKRSFASDIAALKHYVEDSNNPKELVTLGQYIIASYHLGTMEGYRESCKILHSNGDGATESAQEICGRVLDENQKFMYHRKALGDKSGLSQLNIPSKAFAKLQPIQELPHPQNVDSDIPRAAKSDSGNWKTYLLGGVAATLAIALPWMYYKMKDKGGKDALPTPPLKSPNTFTTPSKRQPNTSKQINTPNTPKTPTKTPNKKNDDRSVSFLSPSHSTTPQRNQDAIQVLQPFLSLWMKKKSGKDALQLLKSAAEKYGVEVTSNGWELTARVMVNHQNQKTAAGVVLYLDGKKKNR